MFDFHRHITLDKTIDNAFYSTSKIEEWEKTSKYFSYGILANNFNIDIDEYEKLLTNKLIENPNHHIGEVGLDLRYENMKIQELFFKKSLLIANKFDRILTIHIVNSSNQLLRILEENKKNLPKHIIYHGFNKSIEFAQYLQKYNVIVSINPKITNTKLINSIKMLDEIGFLVESDWDKETDENYYNYFNNFINTLETLKVQKFKEKNNEFRSILENF